MCKIKGFSVKRISLPLLELYAALLLATLARKSIRDELTLHNNQDQISGGMSLLGYYKIAGDDHLKKLKIQLKCQNKELQIKW